MADGLKSQMFIPKKRMLLAYRHQSGLDCLLILIRATDSHFHLLDAAALLYYH